MFVRDLFFSASTTEDSNTAATPTEENPQGLNSHAAPTASTCVMLTPSQVFTGGEEPLGFPPRPHLHTATQTSRGTADPVLLGNDR